jgi:serine/threonine-protein kinase
MIRMLSTAALPDDDAVDDEALTRPAEEDDLHATRAPRVRVLPARAPRLGAGRVGPAAAAGAARPEGGRMIGRYQLLGTLGRGAMASVYKAHDPGIGRTLAIKFLHASLCADEVCRERFLREARAAGGLSHPNIVTVYDVGEIDGRPYIAMELLEGSTLADQLDGGKPLPVRDALQVALQLARALSYAHGMGVVHRDIKPANVMRVARGRIVKLADFGIARVTQASAPGQLAQTRAGDVLGTPQYMSPEQAEGGAVDGRSDLFSVGVVLYQMLTGKRPFDADSLMALALQITQKQPRPIEQLRPELPPSVRKLVARLLAKSPDKRFQTGRELADAINRALFEVQEQGREHARQRGVPLRVKWAAGVSACALAVLGLGAMIILDRQQAALQAQMIEQGATLVRFMAAQNALAALDDEWSSVEFAVGEMMKSREFQRISFVDAAGVVRATSVADQRGQAWLPPGGAALALPAALAGTAAGVDLRVTRLPATGSQASAIAFETPIHYQGKPLGRVALWLSEQPLRQITRLSGWLLAVQVLVTVTAVGLATLVTGKMTARPLRIVGQAMAEFGRGRLDHRIGLRRNDEIGLLYRVFDRMADEVQARIETRRPTRALALDGLASPTGAFDAANSAVAPLEPVAQR